jgi:hypothetical protein
MASRHVRLSAVSPHPVGFGPLHGECKGKTPKGERMVQLARDPDGGDELVMDVPEIKSTMRENFAGLAADPNPLASADWDRVACPGGRPLAVHPTLRGPLSGLMDVC